ncbi:MAG: NAD(P)H-binding protein [Acidobacteria bacterium]|nr:NAD(P)H-binding protein [Acidobacteriota bacterium]
MRIVVSTPTGNVGRVATEKLLEAGAEVVVIHRDPASVEGFASRGAEVRRGTIDDPASLTAATEGADALLWVTPGVPNAVNLRATQNDFGAAAAAAIQANDIPRVVNISGVGAHHDAGTGPIAGLHDVEEMLDATGAAVLHLRPAYFFENYVPQVQVINAMGAIMLPVSGDRSLPMISASDIGVAAADELLDESWSESSIRGLHGPADLTFDEAAAAISAAIGRQVSHTRIDEMQARMGLSMLGLGQGTIDAMIELYNAIESGHLTPAEPRTDETTTATTIAEWAAEVMAPQFG